jgi:hypothetical protein
MAATTLLIAAVHPFNVAALDTVVGRGNARD